MLDLADDDLRRLGLVVAVQRAQTVARRDIQVRQQPAGAARVLGVDEIGVAQRLDRPQAEVTEVADGRGHEIEAGGEWLGLPIG